MKLFSRSLVPPAFYMLVSIAAGILAGRHMPLTCDFFFAAFLTCLLVLITLVVIRAEKSIFIPVCLAGLITGLISIQDILAPSEKINHISNFSNTQKVAITAKVNSFVKHYPNKIQFLANNITILEQRRETQLKGNLRITLYGQCQRIRFGDSLSFSARIKHFRNFSNPDGFDYQTHMKMNRIHASAHASLKNVIILSNTRHSIVVRIIRCIEAVRLDFHERVISMADGKSRMSGVILSAMVTGKKETLNHGIRDVFAKAGISHLLAISGLHLSIIALVSYSILYRFFCLFQILSVQGRSQKAAWMLTVIPVSLYAIFSGFSPSTQRAYAMILIFLTALMSDKEKDTFSSLCVAGIIILLWDAAALFSISFQLSFCAVLFIIGGMLLIRHHSLTVQNQFLSYIVSMAMVSFFAGLGTLPLSAHYFNLISHVQIVTNFVAVPIIGFLALPLGFAALFISVVSNTIAGSLIDLSCILIDAVTKIARVISELPGTWSRVPAFGRLEAGLYFSFTLTVFFFLTSKKRIAGILAFCTLIFALKSFLPALVNINNPENSDLTVTILDVGQGSAAFIHTPDDKRIIVDGGGFSDSATFDTGRFIIAPFLWSKNIKKLDTVIMTHPEADHMNGLIFILNNFKVNTLIKNHDQRASEKYQQLINICSKRGVKILRPPNEFNQINMGRVDLFFFPSFSGLSDVGLNNNSLVFKIVFNNFGMLFTGDIHKDRERLITETSGDLLTADILLAPHHGSNTSSSKFFLDHVRAKSVIMSCGFQNRYGFPHPAVLKRYKDMGLTVFRTDLHGAVTITSIGSGYQIKTIKGE